MLEKKIIVIWITRKMQSLFHYKDKVQHHSFVVYRKSSSRCSCETIRNTEIRCNEHNAGKIKILILKHLNYYLVHEFRWFVLSCASTISIKSKILDVYYINTGQPSLITQMNSDLFNLFRNCCIDLQAFIPHAFISIVLLFISILYI